MQPDMRSAPDEEGLLETAASLFVHPVVTLRRVSRQRPIDWAIAIIVVLAAASLVIDAARLSPRDFVLDPSDAPESFSGGVRIAMVLGALTLGPVIGLVVSALISGLFHVVSRMMGGAGTFAGMFAAYAFASLPGAVLIPAAVFPIIFGSVGGRLELLVLVTVLFWSAILTVVAVRENYGFTTARAVAAVLIPVAALILGAAFLVVIAVIIAVLFAVTQV